MSKPSVAAFVAALKNPPRLWSREELLDNPSRIPAAGGIYAWFFRKVPKDVPLQHCIVRDGLTLLYVGIAPKYPGSKATLRSRIIRQHHRSNAAGSTLRLTLGCLLQTD